MNVYKSIPLLLICWFAQHNAPLIAAEAKPLSFEERIALIYLQKPHLIPKPHEQIQSNSPVLQWAKKNAPAIVRYTTALYALIVILQSYKYNYGSISITKYPESFWQKAMPSFINTIPSHSRFLFDSLEALIKAYIVNKVGQLFVALLQENFIDTLWKMIT